MSEGFWRIVRDFANRRYSAAVMDRIHHQRRCPVCHTWSAETGGARDYVYLDEHHDAMRCGKCLKWSKWRVDGPVASCIDAWPDFDPSPRFDVVFPKRRA